MKENIRTDRLLLRPFREGDIDASYEICGNEENVKYLLKSAQTRAQCEAFVRMAIGTASEEPRVEYHFAVEYDGRLIGTGSLSVYDGDQGGLNWVIHRDFWNRGFCTEVGRLCWGWRLRSWDCGG